MMDRCDWRSCSTNALLESAYAYGYRLNQSASPDELVELVIALADRLDDTEHEVRHGDDCECSHCV